MPRSHPGSSSSGRSGPPAPSSKPPVRYAARTDGRPHRPWSSLNIRRGDKLRVDVVLAWESLEAGRTLSHWDGFSKIFEGYLRSVEGRLPSDVMARLAAADVDVRADDEWFDESTSSGEFAGPA